MPGSRAGWPAVYYFLAALESIAVLGLLVSLLKGEFLPGKSKRFLKFSLIYSLFVFVVLSFGSRLSGKLDVAAINMLYFVGALLSFRETVRAEPLADRRGSAL